jgi:hypothetical protein
MRLVHFSWLGPLLEEVDCIRRIFKVYVVLLILHLEIREYLFAERLELLDMLAEVIKIDYLAMIINFRPHRRCLCQES